MSRSEERVRLDDILLSGGGGGNFDDLWNATDAAEEFGPLPAGRYLCLVVSGTLAESREKQTPSYKLTLEVIKPAEHAGRKTWHHIYLTPRALPMAKRDLAKLGITHPKQPLPAGIVADARVALRTDSEGRVFNRVAMFKVVDAAEARDALAPDAAELGEADGEAEEPTQ